ncbi:hypothetical protein DFJ74DRAFT_673545 [Hyaloraphidium curvatum]|nr:hypothetical protein DFJ74DRAFT_673545 [Hyaloraphidium curvatum]
MASDRSPLRIHVIGGSVAGLAGACAALTHHPNCKVVVHERSSGPLEERGAGIGGTFGVMRKITGTDPRKLGFRYVLPLGTIAERDTRPRKQVRMKGAWRDTGDDLIATTTYDNIINTLLKALDASGGKLVRGHALEGMKKLEDGTTELSFGDGSKEIADLVICGDGAQSPCRSLLYGSRGLDGTVRYSGYVAWRGILTPDMVDDPEIRSAFIPEDPTDRKKFWMLPVFNGPSPYAMYSLYYPVPARHNAPASEGTMRLNWAWFQPADHSQLRSFTLDRNGVQHEYSLAPGQVRHEVVDQMLAYAKGRLGGDGLVFKLAKRIVELDKLFMQAILEFEPKHMSFPEFNALLIGDAAAVATPMTGQGAGKALRDAAALGDLLKAHPYDVRAVLEGYERERLKDVQEIVTIGIKMHSNHHWIAKHTVWDAGVYSGEVWGSTEDEESATQKEAQEGRLEIGYDLLGKPFEPRL